MKIIKKDSKYGLFLLNDNVILVNYIFTIYQYYEEQR